MTRCSRARRLRRICIPAALLMSGVCLFLCALPAAAAAPAQTPETVIVGLATPTPTPADTPTPTPAETPAPDPAAAQTEEQALAAEALNASRSPNRLKSAQIDAIVQTLPEGLSLSRALIVVKAYSLLDKVSYQWGGKSREMGWDRRWDKQTAAGIAPEKGKAAGLDCSGYVQWCFSNAAGTAYVGDRMGSGTYKQWLSSVEIAQEEILPGDLMFTNWVGRDNHNGIVAQVDEDGGILVIHCVKKRGVVIESASEGAFVYARRPDLLNERSAAWYESSMLRHRGDAHMADLRYLLTLRNW